MNFFNSLFLTEIDFCIPNVIQGFVLNISLYLLIFVKGVYLLSKEFIAGLKDWTNLYQSNPR